MNDPDLSSKETKIIDVCRYSVDWIGLGYPWRAHSVGGNKYFKESSTISTLGGGGIKKSFLFALFICKNFH